MALALWPNGPPCKWNGVDGTNPISLKLTMAAILDAKHCIKTINKFRGWVFSSFDHEIRGGFKYTIFGTPYYRLCPWYTVSSVCL